MAGKGISSADSARPVRRFPWTRFVLPSYVFVVMAYTLVPIAVMILYTFNKAPNQRLTFSWHDNEKRMWRYVFARSMEIMKAMNPSRIVKTTPEIPDYNIHDYQSTHPTGGCIMGSGPGDSVTNEYGQVWDTPNVFVTGAALFPQNPGANPTGTIGALTYRTADAIADRYWRSPGELL